MEGQDKFWGFSSSASQTEWLHLYRKHGSKPTLLLIFTSCDNSRKDLWLQVEGDWICLRSVLCWDKRHDGES